MRFSEFEKFSGFLGDSEKNASGCFFQSVTKAAEQDEDMRQLAERAMYLGSRLPMLTGAFTDGWASRLTRNQDVSSIIADLNRLVEVTPRIGDIAEKLQGNIAKENALGGKRRSE